MREVEARIEGTCTELTTQVLYVVCAPDEFGHPFLRTQACWIETDLPVDVMAKSALRTFDIRDFFKIFLEKLQYLRWTGRETPSVQANTTTMMMMMMKLSHD